MKKCIFYKGAEVISKVCSTIIFSGTVLLNFVYAAERLPVGRNHFEDNLYVMNPAIYGRRLRVAALRQIENTNVFLQTGSRSAANQKFEAANCKLETANCKLQTQNCKL